MIASGRLKRVRNESLRQKIRKAKRVLGILENLFRILLTPTDNEPIFGYRKQVAANSITVNFGEAKMTTQPVTHSSAFTSQPQPMSREDRDSLLLEWKEAQEQLAIAKEHEMRLRKRIVAEAGLFDPNKEEGTQTVVLGGGWKLKAVKKLNWKVFETIDGLDIDLSDAIQAIEEIEGKMAADEIVKFDPRLSVSTFKKLMPEAKAIIEPFLQSSPASPSLELVPPKDKK